MPAALNPGSRTCSLGRRSFAPLLAFSLALLALAGPLAPGAQAKSPRSPATARALQAETDAQDWRRFEPRGREYSLPLPPGWTLAGDADKATGVDFEVRLTVPGPGLLDYALISVRCVTSPHRTLERFLYDLRHPAFASPAAQAAALQTEIRREALSGQEAWVTERQGERSLIGFDERVPVRTRTIILPQSVGFFVLTLDTPEASAAQTLPAFGRLAREFRPLLQPRPRGPELSAGEREVYASFFRSKGKTRGDGLATGTLAQEAPAPGGKAQDDPVKGSALDQLAALAQAQQAAPPRPEPPNESLRLLQDTGKARLVTGRTQAAPALDSVALAALTRDCGEKAQADALLSAWNAVRGQQVLVTDAILVPGLEVEEGRAPAGAAQHGRMADQGRQSAELMSRLSGAVSGGRPFFSGQATLSRVAFSPDGGLALFHVSLGRTSPGTRHFVLLRRIDAPVGAHAESGQEKGPSWAVCGAVLRGMIIY